jgi:peptidoglycan/LPS O-acetylase OafA/YrhL
MNLNPHRPWITPLVIGTFALSAVTGVLMFFHWDTGLNKTAHEWLGWAMVAAAAFHALLHWHGFKRHWAAPVGKAVIVTCLAVLALSFAPLGSSQNEPPFVRPIKTLAATPLPVLAQVAGVDMPTLKSRLQAAGKPATADDQTIVQLAGPDTKAQLRLLNQVLVATAP